MNSSRKNFWCVKSAFGQWECGLETPLALAVAQSRKARRSTADFPLFICFAAVEHGSEGIVGMKGAKDNGDVLTGAEGGADQQLIPPPNR